MNTIEFENKVFYALNGFTGYYASLNGEVLSTNKGTKILKHGKGINQAYHFSQHNKITVVTKSRVIYMVQTGCSLNDLNGCWVGLKDGKYVKSENRSDILETKTCNPLNEIEFMRNEMNILEAFYLTGNVTRLKEYIDSKREEFESYGIRNLMQGREKVIGLVSDTLSDFYTALQAINQHQELINNEIMKEENDVYKIACYTSKNEQTGRIIEVALCSEKTDNGIPIVTIATDEGQLVLSLQDISGLISSLESIVNFTI